MKILLLVLLLLPYTTQSMNNFQESELDCLGDYSIADLEKDLDELLEEDSSINVPLNNVPRKRPTARKSVAPVKPNASRNPPVARKRVAPSESNAFRGRPVARKRVAPIESDDSTEDEQPPVRSHKKRDKNTKQHIKKAPRIECPFCFTNLSQKYINQHIRFTHPDEQPYQGDEHFIGRDSLRQRHTTIQKQTSPIPSSSISHSLPKEDAESPKYTCNKCALTFANEEDLLWHQQNIHTSLIVLD